MNKKSRDDLTSRQALLIRRIRRDLDQHLAEIVAPEHFGKGAGDGLEALANIFAILELT